MFSTVSNSATKSEIVIDTICRLNWPAMSERQMLRAAWAYYYFSIQFRESLEAARRLFPHDENLADLYAEECDTANLSPYPDVAEPGERLNHDEFMFRLLQLTDLAEAERSNFMEMGEHYLAEVRPLSEHVRASSIASYEDGGLERVFRAILRSPDYANPTIRAFRFFMEEHIRFDSDPQKGHGALSRHLDAGDGPYPLWVAFRDVFLSFVPELRDQTPGER